MQYFTKLFSSRGVRAAPVATLGRGLQLFALIAFKKGAVISVPFGGRSFRFNYVHGKAREGGRGLFLFREYIEDLMAHGDGFLRVGDVVIDGGANQGVFTTAFASYVSPNGKVIAIEPMEYAVQRIKGNVALNGLSDQVVVYQNALSNDAGTATLDLSLGVGPASITNDYGGKETMDVETKTIDQIVEEQKLDHVDFIKLDIEGAELKALLGAAATLAKFKPTVCLEISTGGEYGSERLAHDHMMTLGYTAFEFEDGTLIPL